jgi:hypothetical protein
VPSSVEKTDIHLSGKLVALHLWFASEAEAADYARAVVRERRLVFEMAEAVNIVINGDLQNAGRE